MSNRTYYGEYSLKYWIELVLSKKIVLPEYQRTFVWNKDDVLKLIQSFKDNLFVPSITIGNYEGQDLIIDGQQRLSSLLLSFLGKYPKLDKFSFENTVPLANENDDVSDSDNDAPILGWTFNELLKKGSSKEQILSSDLSDYDTITNLNLAEDFFENNYLGFSYLIPEDNPQKYFSSVFKNINESGKKLSSLETRRSLYFLKEGMEQFFDPDCIKNIIVEKDKKRERIDFVRYLSLDSQYKKNENASNLLKNYGKKEEKYYNDFIDHCISQNANDMFTPFNDSLKHRIESLKQDINKLNFNGKTFTSIIDCDIYLFGLVFYSIFEDKHINDNDVASLKEKLEDSVNEIKNDSSTGTLHKKTPSALKYLRLRVSKSIEIYREYMR
ncbi:MULTISPECIES: DUF262 domain-containing protein [unclassified Fibrobacter]|uniref:DUF262 domain-containing protein n=1 Tax=unclassified Fibrobacter TaxID=2634177 RepID=UPI0025C3710E|nr:MULTISPECIES: DUF262 domain-containing protein [unclassified Fibrobacter]